MKKKTAFISGASKGLGYALATTLAKEGWQLLITARTASKLLEAKTALSKFTTVEAISGDLRDEIHLLEIAGFLERKNWQLDLVVNNASFLGDSPMQKLLDHSIDNMHLVLHTNMIAPISLLQKVKTQLSLQAKIINISSDAAVEKYERWGIYGAAKAGMDFMSAILAIEHPQYRFYAFDPGDMRTDMHQQAFPTEDISDRPLPEDFAVPKLLELVESNLQSGRYTVNSEILNIFEDQAG